MHGERLNERRINRLETGDWSFGCGGTHRGNGTEDCPKRRHHHHDEFCAQPTILELQAAGIDPSKFRPRSRA